MKKNKSNKLFKEAQELMPGGVNSPVRAFKAVGGNPFFVDRALGSRIWDVDDNEYIDYVGSWGPSILGHADPHIVEAVREQAEKGFSYGVSNPWEVKLAKKISAWMPSIEKIRMTNSGTEAVMGAIRLARGFTKRQKIIKFDGCYHGHADSMLVKTGSGGLTMGQPDSKGVPPVFASLTFSVPYNDLEAVQRILEREKKGVAAIIVEPIAANAGLIIPNRNFLDGLRRLANAYDALLIFDEVMTGFRVGKGGAQKEYRVKPDLTTLGKIIGGGFPIGAIGGRKEIMDYLAPEGPVYQAGTLSGNPISMLAGLTQLEKIEKTNAYEKLEVLGKILEDGIKEILKEKKLSYTFERFGSMFCLFFTENNVNIKNLKDVMKMDQEKFKDFFNNMLKAGVYLPPSPFETSFISTAHTKEDLKITIKAISEAL